MSFCECLDSYHLVTVFTNCGNIPIRVSLQCLIDLHSSHTSGLIVITGCTYGGRSSNLKVCVACTIYIVGYNGTFSADKCLCDQNILIYCQRACYVVLLEKVPNLIILYLVTMDLCFSIVPYTGER